MHILLVEDDALVARGIIAGLRLHGATVDHVASAKAADAALAVGHFDLVVLDLGLPDADGMTLLRRPRRNGSAAPILVLTARDALADRIAGLRDGADDYLLKPFDLGELTARLQALHRRAAGRCVDIIRHGPLCVDTTAGRVVLQGIPVALSPREFALLQALLHQPDRILSAEQLKAALYGFDDNVESNALNVYIHHLRRKLGPRIVETVRGIGFRLGAAGR